MLENSQETPQLPPRYHHTFSPVGALLNPAEDVPLSEPAAEAEPQRLDQSASEAGARALTHKIVDGDTLATLAAKYLGDAQRWRELYEHNADLLTNPELLPIGRVIRIPTAAQAAALNASQPEASPAPLAPIPRGAFRRD